MTGDVARSFPGWNVSWLAGGDRVLAVLVSAQQDLGPTGDSNASIDTPSDGRARGIHVLDPRDLSTTVTLDLDPEERPSSLSVDDLTDRLCWLGVRPDRTWSIRTADPVTGDTDIVATSGSPASTRGLPVLTAINGVLCWAESTDQTRWRTMAVDLTDGSQRVVAEHNQHEWARKCYALADGRVLHVIHTHDPSHSRIDLSDDDGRRTILPHGEHLAIWHDRFAVVSRDLSLPSPPGRSPRQEIGTGWITDGTHLAVAQPLISRPGVHRIRYDRLGRLVAMTVDALERGSEDGWGRWRWERIAAPGRPFTTVGEVAVVADFEDGQAIIRVLR